MFTVPIIAPDLRHEETIIQAAHALNVLQQTIDNIFQQLDARIAVNSGRVKDLGMRIQSADQRIRNLVGVKKAVQIYAPARYPATHVLKDTAVTFVQEAAENRMEDEKYEIKSGFESIHPDSRHDKLMFFHLSTTNNVASLKAGASPAHITASRLKLHSNGHTLGAPPQNLRSIAALLRFNTAEQVYNRQTTNEQSAVRADSWRRAKMPKNPQKPQKKLLEPAPHSLANRNQRATPAGDLRYMPKMHEAPLIDLPMDLDGLDGIAQDIHFMGTNIAKKETKESKTEEVKVPARKFSCEVIDTTTKITLIKKSETTALTTTPPPPPPPPPPVQKPETVNSSKSLDQSKTPPAIASDTRSALMDAIRQAGGAHGGRLRSAAAAPVDIAEHKKPAAPSAGNLMEDLHNKLLMRRKGISGSSFNSTRTDASSSNPVLQRLSALIPPPPTKQAHSDDEDVANNAEDGDWD